jgi:predicted ABC-type ATPase
LTVNEFVNADTIALGLSAYRPEAAAFAAGRVMLERLDQLARAREDFAFETTLSGRTYLRWLELLRAGGYRVHLVFLALSSPELALARVAERVRKGGHDVPEAVVRRRFAAGLRNLVACYLDVVDSWHVYDNSNLAKPRLLASRAPGSPAQGVGSAAWQRLLELKP